MRYDAVLKFADEGADTFHDYRLPAVPITHAEEEEAVHHNVTYVMVDKLDWTEIFEDSNHPAIPDMTPIPFTGDREEFDVAATEEEINNMKDSNGTI